MTPEQRLIAKWLFIVLFLIGIFFSGFGVRGYMANHELTVLQLDQAKTENAQLDQYAKDLKGLADTNQALRNQVHRLDSTHTKALNEKLDENRALRADLAVAQRMSLKGTSCPKASGAGDIAGSPGMGDGAAVVLSRETGLAVFDLREDLIRDRAKLAYLQEERRTLSCQVQKSPG